MTRDRERIRRNAMAEGVQTYKKHTRILPGFHYFVLPVMFLNVLVAIRRLWMDP